LLLCIIPYTHTSHFCKLTTFIVVELFFLYNLPKLKTLWNLTNSCYYRAPPPSRANTKKKQRKKTGKKK
jgi:hypothetical protein